ncbi:hypothetical protein PAESOLCIP111_06042 [Paenibacillus solanacearum]|uniref:Conserved hypothetical protein CHP03032 domain-containing protein n=1 Tax=Paenibacillus solanacearum TaxID=2048548 RepID=A0A916KAF0_9BACL|nr:DUF4915 domain-containing protein [Paenibacillus solanacearum]CAG7650260.1 hypothetical protein PAESOLCIP111_06042 [Paenibacillus solanacearum]
MLLYGLENDQDFQYVHTRLLVSCPASGPDEGGLFLLDFQRNAMQKLYTASCMGMAWADNKLIVATDDNQILAFDSAFRLTSRTKHRKLDFHGVAKLSERVVLVAETAVNAIGCYETDTFTRIGEIRFNPIEKDIHHINDIWLEGSTLYVSMFSPYDKWFLDPMQRNGAIIAVDLTGFHPHDSIGIDPANHIVVSRLYMPHTVMVHNAQLAYCDSMSFYAVTGNDTKIQVAGFTRGLAITDDTVFIGQSRMRHVLRIPHEMSNCSLDGGIYVYNPEFRISRFVPLPAQQVYQILILQQQFPSGG